VAKNPFYVPEYPAEAAAGDERLSETLQRMELVVCGLVSYHPVDEIANNYFLRALRWTWTAWTDAVVIRADWDVVRTVKRQAATRAGDIPWRRWLEDAWCPLVEDDAADVRPVSSGRTRSEPTAPVPAVPRPANVAIAFGLGWHMAELYHFERIPGEVEHDGPASLPGIGGLSRGDRADLLVSQIVGALVVLGHQTHAWEAMRQRVNSTPVDVTTLQLGVEDAHWSLLKTLTTQELKSFVVQFNAYRIQALQAQLVDLHTALPKWFIYQV